MKYLLTNIFVGLCLLITGGCATKNRMTGNDRDSHGCISSAGYTWSEVRQSCIRIFEEGVRLNNSDDPQATLAAYAVFSANNDSVELFLPEKDKHPVLARRDDCWSDRDYVLCNENGRMCLLYKGKIIFCN